MQGNPLCLVMAPCINRQAGIWTRTMPHCSPAASASAATPPPVLGLASASAVIAGGAVAVRAGAESGRLPPVHAGRALRVSHDCLICTGRGQAKVLHMVVGLMLAAKCCSGATAWLLCNSRRERRKGLAARLAELKVQHDMNLARLCSHLRHAGCRHQASACGQAHPLHAPSCSRLKGGSTRQARAG